ncbi:MAG: sigma-54-dependent Fis family transcriptional regulator [Myxococcales bacterium]|nr:sigma-54-dependent Fis family transcriptional regulator [Myxococcales bacterium]
MIDKQPNGKKARILVADDDASMRSVLRFNLIEEGYDVTIVEDGQQALKAVRAANPPFDLVVSDVKMPGLTGMEVLNAITAQGDDTAVVLVTAFGSVEDAVGALEAGAVDYITKPFRRAEFKTRIVRALEQRQLRRDHRRLQAQVLASSETFVTASPRMMNLLGIIDRIAPSDAVVLITGESGTGKELVAKRIHQKSLQNEGPFVPVNCAALPRDLLETELFGHEKGAFTGAHKTHRGKFELANNGTLFLDEIGELPLELQSKLLRVLEEGIIDRIGGDQRQPVKVRVVAATNRDLRQEVEAGRFRRDLFHRLNVIGITIPSLRERPEDIVLLAKHFLHLQTKDEVTLAPTLAEALEQRLWSGNVRELKNLISRMILLRRGPVLDLADLAEPGQKTKPEPPSKTNPPSLQTNVLRPGHLELPDEPFDLMELEKEIVEKALAKHGGNQSATARYLTIPRHVLIYRLEKFSGESTDSE